MPIYSVKFQDGHTQEFTGPANMTDTDAYERALQERAFSAGKIPTTFRGGAAKALGEDPVTTGALIGGAGMLTGTAPLVAAAPLAARGIQYATQKMTGQEPAAPSPIELAMLAGEGAVLGYGPAMIANAGRGLATSTVPHISPISGKFVPGVKGPGVGAWAGRTAGEAGNAVAKALEPLTPASVGDRVWAILKGTDTLTMREIGALRLKLADPKLANNPVAKQAIATAIKARGGRP